MIHLLIEQALTKVLKYHPDLADKCRRLNEKNIMITLLPFQKQWTIFLSKGEVRCFNGASSETPDLCISATPSALIAMIVRDDKTGLTLEGDLVLAQLLQQCLHLADLDWESAMNDMLGEKLSDAIGYPMMTFLQKSREKIKQIHDSTKLTLVDFLQEDTDSLPLPSEVNEFCEAVDDLKQRVDRLTALWKLK